MKRSWFSLPWTTKPKGAKISSERTECSLQEKNRLALCQIAKKFYLCKTESWQSGRMQRFRKPSIFTDPGVRIPHFPLRWGSLLTFPFFICRDWPWSSLFLKTFSSENLSLFTRNREVNELYMFVYRPKPAKKIKRCFTLRLHTFPDCSYTWYETSLFNS